MLYPSHVSLSNSKWKAAPMEAMERHMMAADTSSSGRRPARSTSIVLTPFMTSCTKPTSIVAVIGSNLLPATQSKYALYGSS